MSSSGTCILLVCPTRPLPSAPFTPFRGFPLASNYAPGTCGHPPQMLVSEIGCLTTAIATHAHAPTSLLAFGDPACGGAGGRGRAILQPFPQRPARPRAAQRPIPRPPLRSDLPHFLNEGRLHCHKNMKMEKGSLPPTISSPIPYHLSSCSIPTKDLGRGNGVGRFPASFNPSRSASYSCGLGHSMFFHYSLAEIWALSNSNSNGTLLGGCHYYYCYCPRMGFGN